MTRSYVRLGENASASCDYFDGIAHTFTVTAALPAANRELSFEKAVAKIERGHPQDRLDVAAMIQDGLVDLDRLAVMFGEIEPDLIKYPAIDATALAATVSEIAIHGNGAYSQFNAFIRQLVSFERALEQRVSRGQLAKA